MKVIETTRMIAAPLEVVFATIADARNFAEAVPHILNIEFLTDQQVGAGTRFRETRQVRGRAQAVDLEVKEYEENCRVRMVSDAGGTIWNTLFTVEPSKEVTKLEMRMDADSYKLVAKLVTPMIRGMVAKAVEADMDAVKTYCEGLDANPTGQ